jgi:hypothetical protein
MRHGHATSTSKSQPRIAIHDRQKRATCPCYYVTPAFHLRLHHHSSTRRSPRHPPVISNVPLLGRQRPRHGRRPPPHCRRSDQGGRVSGARVLRDACLALAVTLRHCPRPFFLPARRDETRRDGWSLDLGFVGRRRFFVSFSYFLPSHFTFSHLLLPRQRCTPVSVT